tara:strand:- start:360 stop:545 length:186 start_codon:yes stop_codon:yes gene_type:complete
MKKYNIWYIPWDKLMGPDPSSHIKWMIVMADNTSQAKRYGRQDGLVTEISLLGIHQSEELN